MDNQPRKLSNKKYILSVIIGVITMAISGGIYIKLNNKILEHNLCEIKIIMLCIFGLILFLFGVLGIILNNKTNDYLKELAYNFDYQNELSKYKRIGKKNEKLKKYSDWKGHIENKYENLINKENPYHYFVRQQRNKEVYKELIAAAVIPIEIGMLTAFYTAKEGSGGIVDTCAILIVAVIFVLCVSNIYVDCKEEINFINDLIDVLFPEIEKRR